MTAIDIDAIRKLADAATDGPWWAWDRGVGYVIAVGEPGDVDEYDRPRRELPEGMRTDIGRREDAEFIAAARTLVPALCDELEQTRAALTASRENAANLANENGRLLAENARLRQQRDDTLAELTDAGNEVDLLEAENKRLRAALIDVGKANGVTHVWDHREKDWVPIAQFAASKAEVPS